MVLMGMGHREVGEKKGLASRETRSRAPQFLNGAARSWLIPNLQGVLLPAWDLTQVTDDIRMWLSSPQN